MPVPGCGKVKPVDTICICIRLTRIPVAGDLKVFLQHLSRRPKPQARTGYTWSSDGWHHKNLDNNNDKVDESKFELVDRHNELRARVANGREAGQPQVRQNFQENHKSYFVSTFVDLCWDRQETCET